MAANDQDPKTSDVPPDSQAGEFTKLFGKPPKPEPLEGIGTTHWEDTDAMRNVEDEMPEAAVLSDATTGPQSSSPSSFTMMFGVAPSAQTLPPPAPQEPSPEVLTGFEPTGSFTLTPAGELVSESAQIARTNAPPAENPDGTVANAPVATCGTENTPDVLPITPAKPIGPSAFTKLFGSLGHPATAKSAPERSPEPLPAPRETTGNPPTVTVRNENSKVTPGTFTQLFGNPAGPKAANVQPEPHSALTEDFANIFNFPLRDSSSAQPDPAAKGGSEFLSTFNAHPATPSATAPAAKEQGAFTKLFNVPATNAAQTPKAQPADDFDRLFSPTPPETRGDSFTGGIVTREGSLPPASPTPTGGPSNAATQIFSRPGDTPAPAPQPPSGPSAFTQVISGSLIREAQQATSPTAQPFSPAYPGYPPPPAMPPVATPPSFIQPQWTWPPPSAAPHLQTPPMPMMPGQIPQPPMTPPQAASTQPKTNWLPLVIGVNVFVVIVVILILVFALKR